jgi:FlgD Ig-like domain
VRISRIALLFLSLIFFVDYGWSLTIANVSADKNTFDIERQRNLTIGYQLDQAADVQLLIYDARNILIKQSNAKAVNAGENIVQWDGRDQAGNLVPPEVYFYVLVAKTASGESAEYDLTDITGGEFLGIQHFMWDKNAKQLELVLNKPARVVVRAGIKNSGPLLKTLMNWAPLNSGKHTLPWSGWDESNVLPMGDHPQLQFAKDAFTLPSNAIIVQSKTRQAGFINELTWPKQVRQKKLLRKLKMYAPMQVPADKRGDFPMKLSIVGDFPKNKQGVPLVSGKVPVRLNVDHVRLHNLASQRYEPVFYVDGQFVFENEIGFFPMTYVWDSSKVNQGVHYITANLRGYRSNFGMATIKVEVSRE